MRPGDRGPAGIVEAMGRTGASAALQVEGCLALASLALDDAEGRIAAANVQGTLRGWGLRVNLVR